MSQNLPLRGLTVLALEQAVAAPYCTSRLADAGARVIKIERPEGDFARGYDAAVNGLASYFVWLNRGKESLVADIKDPGGCAPAPRDPRADRRLRAEPRPRRRRPRGLRRRPHCGRAIPRLITVDISGYGAGTPTAT